MDNYIEKGIQMIMNEYPNEYETIDDVLKANENVVLFTNDKDNSNGSYVGRIFKEHGDCSFKLGDLVQSDRARISGGVKLWTCAVPESVVAFDMPKDEPVEEEIETEVNVPVVVSNSNVNDFIKAVDILGKMYQLDPDMFKIKFNVFYVDFKLYNKVKSNYNGKFKTKESMRNLYAAISKFDEYVSKYSKKYKTVDYKIINKNVSNSYHIDLEDWVSIIASRNGFKKVLK